jgi:hypothetical protein
MLINQFDVRLRLLVGFLLVATRLNYPKKLLLSGGFSFGSRRVKLHRQILLYVLRRLNQRWSL